jgi:hypothetical protein
MTQSSDRPEKAKEQTVPNGDTIKADRQEAASAHGADRPPTHEEEELAEQTGLDPHTAESSREAFERGAKVKGEGRID